MNHHAKRLMKELETLGFRRDYEAQTRGIAYRHPNDPSQVIKIFDAMSDNSITAARRMANKIAETGWSGPRMPLAIKDRMAAQRREREAARKRDQAARDQRARAAEAEHDARQRIAQADAHRREIESLMMPGGAR